MPQNNVEVVQRIIEHLNETGEAGPLELYHPEVTFTTRGDLGGSDTFSGHRGMVRAVKMFRDAWAQMNVRVIEIIAREDAVVTVISTKLQSHAGVDLEVEEAWAYWLRDGAIVRIEQHGTREEALVAADLST